MSLCNVDKDDTLSYNYGNIFMPLVQYSIKIHCRQITTPYQQYHVIGFYLSK